LTITSNDSESPLILSLVGYCVDPPHLVIDILDGDQDTIDVNIPLGEAFDDHMLAIKNDGGSNLWVKMHIEEEGTLGSVFPLVIGNWWEFMYSEENDEGNIEVEYESDQILNTAEYNGELYYVVETFSNGWFGLKSGQDAIVANYNTEDGLSERKLLSYEPFVGETWTEDGLTITVVEKLDYTTEYLGTIKDCWKVEMVTNDMYGLIDESVEIWYWKIGIGRIAIESDKGNAELKNFQLRSNTDWVGTDETHNEISPSELNNIHMYFNQDTLGTGTKTASLVLFSNDPDNQRMNIPIKMTLDDKPHPRVLSVSPSPGFIDHRTKEITINMSAPIGNYTDNSLTYDFATAGNAFIDAYISYIDSSNSFKITFDNGLSAADIFSFSLQNIESIYGYSLDGNGDGQGGDNYSSDNYVTSMLGDFNVDSTISVEDLSQFVIGLDTDNHDYELGPYNGELPYVSLSTDSKYDIEDIVAFSMMWNWYYSNNTMTFNSFEDEGTPIIIDAEHDSIYIDLQEDLSAYQIQIQYIPGSFFIGASENNVDLFLTHQEHELGIYTIMAEPEDSRLVIPIEIRGKNTEISISYKGLTKEGILAGKMTKSMNIANIPDEFVLFSNYPNPFNPSTKIDYGIPEAVNVQLVVYDLLGREVITLVNGFQEPGYRSVDWHGTDSYGRNVGAGMYFFLIQAGEFRESHKMLLLK